MFYYGFAATCPTIQELAVPSLSPVKNNSPLLLVIHSLRKNWNPSKFIARITVSVVVRAPKRIILRCRKWRPSNDSSAGDFCDYMRTSQVHEGDDDEEATNPSCTSDQTGAGTKRMTTGIHPSSSCYVRKRSQILSGAPPTLVKVLSI